MREPLAMIHLNLQRDTSEVRQLHHWRRHLVWSGTGIPPPPAVPPAPMVPPKPMVPPQPPLPVVKFVGYSPAKMGELPMSHPLQLEVKDIKNPPCQVVEEATGRIRCVSPTARHDPATGTAAFAPLGYVQVKGTSEYPAGISLRMVPKASEFVSCENERIVDYLCQLGVHSFLSIRRHGWVQRSSASLKGGYADWNNLELNFLGTEVLRALWSLRCVESESGCFPDMFTCCQ